MIKRAFGGGWSWWRHSLMMGVVVVDVDHNQYTLDNQLRVLEMTLTPFITPCDPPSDKKENPERETKIDIVLVLLTITINRTINYWDDKKTLWGLFYHVKIPFGISIVRRAVNSKCTFLVSKLCERNKR
jgi:hypothetical protein